MVEMAEQAQDTNKAAEELLGGAGTAAAAGEQKVPEAVVGVAGEKQTGPAAAAQESPAEEKPAVGLHEALFGKASPATQSDLATEGKAAAGPSSAGEKKDIEDTKDENKKTGSTEDTEGAEWQEGHRFRVGRTDYVVGETISAGVANEIRRGWQARAEAQRVKGELERVKQTPLRGQESAATEKESQTKVTPIPPATQKAGETTATAAKAAVPIASPAGPSEDEQELSEALEKELAEEFGEERGKDIVTAIQTLTEMAATRSTADLRKQNEALQKELQTMKPALERHGAALSEVEQAQAETQALKILDGYLDTKPELREIGADKVLMLECYKAAQQEMFQAGIPIEEVTSSMGRMACIKSAEAEIARRFREGTSARGKTGTGGKGSLDRRPTTPNGAAGLRGGAIGSRDANAEALKLVQAR